MFLRAGSCIFFLFVSLINTVAFADLKDVKVDPACLELDGKREIQFSGVGLVDRYITFDMTIYMKKGSYNVHYKTDYLGDVEEIFNYDKLSNYYNYLYHFSTPETFNCIAVPEKCLGSANNTYSNFEFALVNLKESYTSKMEQHSLWLECMQAKLSYFASKVQYEVNRMRNIGQ